MPLLLALVPLAVFTVLVQRRIRSWWLLLPLAFATWALVHASGVHATVAGVLLGFAVPVLRSQAAGGPDAGRAWPSTSSTGSGRSPPGSPCRCSRSSPPASPSAGSAGSITALTDPVALGIVAGLVVGKTIGILGATYLRRPVHPRPTRRATCAGSTSPGCRCSAGIGFTVSLLIGELAFGTGSTRDDHVKIGSPGRLAHRRRARRGPAAHAQPRATGGSANRKTADSDQDGIPDIYQTEPP